VALGKDDFMGAS